MDYWETRFRLLETIKQKKADEFVDVVQKQFEIARKNIEDEIDRFIRRYAVNDKLTLAEANKYLTDGEFKDFKMSLEEYIRLGEINAVHYSSDIARDLERASLEYRITRLAALETNLKAEIASIYGLAEHVTYEGLGEMYSEMYGRTAFEIFKGLGYMDVSFALPNMDLIDSVIRAPWSKDGLTFSMHLWIDQTTFINDLRNLLSQQMINGWGYQIATKQLQKLYDRPLNECKRVIYTESAFFQSQAQFDCYKQLGVERYQFFSELNAKVCPICGKLDTKVFRMDERRPGVNAVPMHPNCVLPDTIVASPDGEAMTKSVYSGEIIELTTSKGRTLSITPNHIVLTSRGWIRAKNLIKGDKIIYYSGWDEFVIGTNPTIDNSISTIEDLFTSISKTRGVSTITMPMSAMDFKGDGIENAEVNVIFIDSFLRDKLNPAAAHFLCDSPLIFTSESREIDFSSASSLAKFLMCMGFTADGIMSSSSIKDVLFRSSLSHHDLISFRLPSDYDARVLKTSSNNASINLEFFTKSVNASSGVIEGNDFIHRQIPLTFNRDIMTNQNITDSSSSTLEDLRNISDTFPGLVEFDDLIRINKRFFSGHVYDISSLSTVYLANGFVTSNCRCVEAPYINQDNQPGFRSGRNAEGRSVEFPENITYEEWYEQVGHILEANS